MGGGNVSHQQTAASSSQRPEIITGWLRSLARGQAVGPFTDATCMALLDEIDRLREALFECYVASGADTDGARTLGDMGRIDPPIDVLAVREVKQLRADYDEAIQ